MLVREGEREGEGKRKRPPCIKLRIGLHGTVFLFVCTLSWICFSMEVRTMADYV